MKEKRALKKEDKIRNSNIELLRIISMFFIVAGHFISQSGSIEYSFCANDYILVFLGSASRIAVNVFLIVGVWYMVDSKFSADRILKLYIQVVTYSLPITAIMMLLNRGNASIKDFARGVLPFCGRGLWFASAYITLMLFKPFLDKVLNWNRKELSLLVGLLAVFISMVCTLPDVQEGYVIDSVWFLVVYLLVGYIKKYPPRIAVSNGLNIILSGGGYMVLVTSIFMGKCFPDGSVLIRAASRFAGQYISDIKTVPNFMIAFLFTMWFMRLKERHSATINAMAKSVFTVYIIHQVPAFISFIWRRIFMADLWIPNHAFWYVAVVVAVLMAICSAIDMARRKTVESIAEKTTVYRKLANLINVLYDFI